MVDISIIIRCKNEEKALGPTLEKIFAQDIRNTFEVIIVDSGSTDRTLEIARKYAVRLLQIPPEDFTFGYALNYGIERAEGKVIVNLSAHCLPTDNNWVAELTSPLIEGRADATYGRQLPVRGINPYEEVSLAKHFPEGEKLSGRVPFSNANCAFSRKLWTELKFDEELPSWEDYLWYLRQREERRFLYCRGAAVYHSHPFSIRDMLRRSFNDGTAFRLMEKKYHINLIQDACPTALSKAGLFLRSIADHVVYFATHGYFRHIPGAPFVRFLAFKAYADGYKSVK
ncbi:MAG: hypothetical protein C0402_15085 [Thermodesulfovibrio sp.]|nr:hypothetical protein [Thermodesulfovibrio sp.]